MGTKSHANLMFSLVPNTRELVLNFDPNLKDSYVAAQDAYQLTQASPVGSAGQSWVPGSPTADGYGKFMGYIYWIGTGQILVELGWQPDKVSSICEIMPAAHGSTLLFVRPLGNAFAWTSAAANQTFAVNGQCQNGKQALFEIVNTSGALTDASAGDRVQIIMKFTGMLEG